MSEVTISTERVLELIAAYGAEPGAWPKDERAAATQLLETAPDLFAAALDEARALDALLQTERVPEPSLQLGETILAVAPTAKRVRKGAFNGLTALIFPQGVRWPAGAALASLMMGLVGGYAYAATGAGYDQADLAYYAAFGVDVGEDWLGVE
ncbi:MAG: hypothetical protein AAGL97_15525 [Pseudomonadota bacterium]